MSASCWKSEHGTVSSGISCRHDSRLRTKSMSGPAPIVQGRPLLRVGQPGQAGFVDHGADWHRLSPCLPAVVGMHRPVVLALKQKYPPQKKTYPRRATKNARRATKDVEVTPAPTGMPRSRTDDRFPIVSLMLYDPAAVVGGWGPYLSAVKRKKSYLQRRGDKSLSTKENGDTTNETRHEHLVLQALDELPLKLGGVTIDIDVGVIY